MSIVSGSDNETPSGGPPDDTLFASLKRQVINGQNVRAPWRKECRRAFDFVANLQWDEDDRRQLDEQHRPAVTFNRVAPVIKAICGLEVNNRQAVTYLPREQGDGGVDEAITATAKWMRDESGAEDEESECFRDMVICGEGWTESLMDYDDKSEGEFKQDRIYPLEMGVFAGSVKSNYSDARGIYRVRDMDATDARLLFDNAYTAEQLHAVWLDPATTPSDGGVGNKQDYPDTTRAAIDRGTGQRTKVRLVQLQWWQKEPTHIVAQNGDAKIQEMTPEEFAQYEERIAQIGEGAPTYSHAKVSRKKYYTAFMGSELIEPRPMPMNEFTFKAMTGDRDHTGKCYYGLLRDLFDPQMWANKWLSQTMHIMNTNAKGGIMAESDAFMNVRKAERDWADNTKIIWVKPGSLEKNKVKERTPPPLPQGLGELMTFALSAMRDVTGVNLELLGQADREQAASLEAQRRQSAMTILATLFDSLRRYRKAQGRLMLHFIQLLPDGTLVRILKQGKQQYIPLVKNKDFECYDVIIDQSPSSPDQKMYIWSVTTQLLQQGIPLSPPTIIALLKYSPYPESVVQEIAQSMGMGDTLPPQVLQQKLEQAEQALQVLEQKLQEALAAADGQQNQEAIKMLELEIKEYEARTARINAELTFAAAEKRNEATLNSAAISALAPQPGAADGEGAPTPASPAPDILNLLMQKMEAMSQHLQQLAPPPAVAATPPDGSTQPVTN